MATPICLGRVVEHIEAGRRLPKETLTLVSEDGALPISLALGAEDFQPGDLVEIRVVRREPAAKARMIGPDGQPLGQPKPVDYGAEHRLPGWAVVADPEDPFETP